MEGVWSGVSSYIALHHVGIVAMRNGYELGRRKVDRAIKELDITSSLEQREVRRAFGVHGREGCARKKSIPIRLTVKVKLSTEKAERVL